VRSPAELLAARVEAGEIPSASWLVGEAGGVLASGCVGNAVVLPESVAATEETIYDLASLTKPLVTSPLALILSREAGFSLGDPVRRFVASFDRQDKREILLEHLLTHTSGLPDWAPLYVRGRSVPEYVEQIARMDLRARPATRTAYSDLGYIVMGEILERAAGAPLDRLAAELILEPAGAEARFRPGPDLLARVAATEEACKYERRKAGTEAAGYRGWREGVIRGEVHDQNAWAAGGVAGHAGLFGTARAVWAAVRGLLGRSPGPLSGKDLEALTLPMTGNLPEPRSAGFRVNRGVDGKSDPGTAAGVALSPETFGHNGFTGTSVWIDPRAGRVLVLLTNRVHPEVRDDVDMNEIRREFHASAAVS